MTRHLRSLLLLVALVASCSMVGAQARQGDADTINPIDPGEGDAVVIVNSKGDEAASITVTEVIDGWDEYPGNHNPRAGTRYVGFVLEVEALTDNLKIGSNELDLQVDPGILIDATSVQSTDEDLPILPKSLTMDKGDSQEFVVVFAVPEDGAYTQLFLHDDDRLVTIYTAASE